MALAVGVLIGGLGQFLVQLPELRRLGVPLIPALDWSHPALRQIAHRLWPAVFSLAAVQVTVVVNTLLASLLRSGTVSYLYYADRVMEFPLGVFGIALATAVLPGMSAQAARGEHEACAPRSASRSGCRRSSPCPPPSGSSCSAGRSCASCFSAGSSVPPRPSTRRRPSWATRSVCPPSRRRGSRRRRSTRSATPARRCSSGSRRSRPTSSSPSRSCGPSSTWAWRWPRRSPRT